VWGGPFKSLDPGRAEIVQLWIVNLTHYPRRLGELAEVGLLLYEQTVGHGCIKHMRLCNRNSTIQASRWPVGSSAGIVYHYVTPNVW
jgi:hypothetical protein